MTETLITVNHVSKKFCRSLKRSLWYGLQDMGAELLGSTGERDALRADEFWALQNVSFELKRGETLGLIGRNGAGKTTLLKLMSGLIKPDTGRIEVKGRMQALIALGAGFNPVLTGRENIYVNAAVFGMSRSDVNNRFDEIVDFSGIGEFIDSPVQSYSSGMIVRLGFAVAVHMEPDVLLVDEVLAVGDVPFRAKCHRKLGQLKERGIPWILVSHNMGTIRNQAEKVIFLERGQVKYIGTPEEGISRYLYAISEQQLAKEISSEEWIDGDAPTLGQPVRIRRVTLLDANYQEREYFETGKPLIIQIEYAAASRLANPAFGMYIFGVDGTQFIAASTAVSGFQIEYIQGQGCVYYREENLSLVPGIYRVRVDIWDKNMAMSDKSNEAAYLHVKGGAFTTGLYYSPHTWMLKNGSATTMSEEENVKG